MAPDRSLNRRLGRWLSWLLRHGADEAGVPLGAGGWASVDDVLVAAAAAGVPLDRATLAEVVASDAKGRFSLDGQGRVRANQGHSLDVDLSLPAAPPPPLLFHGTHEGAVASILASGLDRRGRHHVHLSADDATARAVGARRGRPVVFAVDAAAMAADGWTFSVSTNGVWLVDAVPARYLRRLATNTGMSRSVRVWYSA